MYNKYILALAILVILVLSILVSVEIAGTSTGNKSDSPAMDEKTVREIVLDLLRKDGVALTKENLYSYLYGGRVIEFRAGQLRPLLGASPMDVHVAAYTDTYGWISLPIRIYNPEDVVKGNSIYYFFPKKISDSTIIDLRLPEAMPIEKDPRKNTPLFGRGAREHYILTIVDREYGVSFTLYIILHSEVPNEELYTYMVDHVGVADPFETAVSAPSLNLIGRHMDHIKARYGRPVLKKLVDHIIRGKIPPKYYDYSIDVPPGPPNLPDGGGGPTYNIVELRPFAFRELEEHSIRLSHTFNFVGFTIPLYSPQDIGDGDVFGYSITLVIKANDTDRANDILDYLNITIDNKFWKRVPLEVWNPNTVVLTKFIYDQPAKRKYGIQLTLDTEDDSDKWNISISVRIKMTYTDALEASLLKPLYFAPRQFVPFSGNDQDLWVRFETGDPRTYMFYLPIPDSIGLVLKEPEPRKAHIYVKLVGGEDGELLSSVRVRIRLGCESVEHVVGSGGPVDFEIPVSLSDIINYGVNQEPLPFFITIAPLQETTYPRNAWLKISVASNPLFRVWFRPLIRISRPDEYLYSSAVDSQDDLTYANIYRGSGAYSFSVFFSNQNTYGEVFYGLLTLVASPETEVRSGFEGGLDDNIHIAYLSNDFSYIDENGVEIGFKHLPIDTIRVEHYYPWASGMLHPIVYKYDKGEGSSLPEPREIPPIVGLLIPLKAVKALLEIYSLFSWGYGELRKSLINDVDSGVIQEPSGGYTYYFELQAGALEELRNTVIECHGSDIGYSFLPENTVAKSYITVRFHVKYTSIWIETTIEVYHYVGTEG